MDTYISEAEKKNLSASEELEIFENFNQFLFENGTSDSYSNHISSYIIKNEKDIDFVNNLNEIREGLILYHGIRYTADINELGTWKNKMVIYLNTEYLFSALEYNGILFKEIFDDFYNLVCEINAPDENKISLKYFPETMEEIENFFASAESILKGEKKLLPWKTAMKKIVDSCKYPSDVVALKVDFYAKLENLGIEISLFNPVRAETLLYAAEAQKIPFEEYSNYVVLFGLMGIQNNDFNLLPPEMIRGQLLIPYATLASYAALIIVPLLIVAAISEQIEAGRFSTELETKEGPLRNMSPKTEQYLGYQKDIRVLDQYQYYLKTDSLKSENYLKVLKFMSHIVPKEIKFTSITIDKDLKGSTVVSNSSTPATNAARQVYRDFILIDGFVDSDPSVADIQLTNFHMAMDRAKVFKQIKLTVKPRDKNQPNRLFFQIDCEF